MVPTETHILYMKTLKAHVALAQPKPAFPLMFDAAVTGNQFGFRHEHSRHLKRFLVSGAQLCHSCSNNGSPPAGGGGGGPVQLNTYKYITLRFIPLSFLSSLKKLQS